MSIDVNQSEPKNNKHSQKKTLGQRIVDMIIHPTKGQMIAVPLSLFFLFIFLLVIISSDSNIFSFGSSDVTTYDSSLSYDDKCTEDKCTECKAEIRCLGCMHMCYNKWDAYFDEDNPYQEQASSCIQSCYKTFDERFSSSRGKEVDVRDWKMR